jgi:hypothetical protein
MITTKTVFILGAGASRSFGYPLGSQLWDQIVNANYDDNFISNFVLATGIRATKQEIKNHINNFVNKLKFAPFKSIDFFLEQNSTYMDVGKTCIAENIIKCESYDNIYKSDENWYEYLLNTCLLTKFENFINNKVSFLTFNYDRSLEFFLYNFLRYGFSKSNDEVIELINKFPIIHLYGQVGLLPWQSADGFEYNENPHIDIPSERYKYAINNINIIYEERNKSFSSAQNLLAEADQICFLGFGYLKENLERLNVQIMAGKYIIGSAHGIEQAERNAILNYFNAHSVEIHLGNIEDKTLQFIRKNFPRAL